jgi:hypothetical protein
MMLVGCRRLRRRAAFSHPAKPRPLQCARRRAVGRSTCPRPAGRCGHRSQLDGRVSIRRWCSTSRPAHAIQASGTYIASEFPPPVVNRQCTVRRSRIRSASALMPLAEAGAIRLPSARRAAVESRTSALRGVACPPRSTATMVPPPELLRWATIAAGRRFRDQRRWRRGCHPARESAVGLRRLSTEAP